MRKISIILLVTIFIFLYGCMPNENITVSFETNGGSLIEDIIIDSSLKFVLPDNPIKEGYTFLGWYLDNDTFEVEYSNILLTDSLTLYAKWIEEEIVYELAIFFESNGGSIVNPIVEDKGEDISEPIAPTREGYEFAGWYSDIDLTSNYEFNVMPAESITLYADWGTVGLEYELINNDTEYSVSEGTSNLLTEIQIPNMKDGKTVVAINQQGFYKCRDLEYITIPNTIEKIGREAFRNCNNLKSVKIPNGVSKIGKLTFANCNSLSNIDISMGVTYIEEFAFFGCSSLVELVIPKSVTYIEENVLRGCSSLKTLTIPFLGESREAIGADALLGYIFGEIEFKGCKSILQKYSTYEDIEYFISAKLDTVIVTDATKLEYGAFYNCSTFTNIIIDGNISSIGQSAFVNCRNLQTITIPEGTISLGEYAFLDCDNLGTLTIPSSLTNIEECALSSKKLTNIIINDNNEKYEFIDGALYDNIDKKLVFVAKNYQGEFNIPLGITKIDTEAFYYCENVTKVVIPTSVNEIGDFAFSNCINLTELIIPISVEIIGEGIVYNTNSLASVYVEALTRPNGWSKLWNSTLKPVFWRYLVIPDTKPIITIVPAMEDLNIGRTTQIIPTITNTTDERLAWSSSNTRVATVDILGVVRGLDFGTTVITATSVADSTVSATVEIQVNMGGSGVLIVTATKTVLAIDNLNEQLSVLSTPGTYRDLSECTFTSADPSVVTITSEGIIQAHSRGTTTVRVTHQTFRIGVIKLTVVD